MSVDDLKREIAEGWPDIPAGSIALRVIDYMAGLGDQELRILTIPTLLRAVERDHIDQEFLAALAILVSSTVHALDAKAFLWEEDDQEVHIDAHVLADARRKGSLENPVSGDIIEDFEQRLTPYFQSSERFLQARAGG